MRRRRKSTGAYCFYCKRDLTPPGEGKTTSFTLDHVKPQAQGGWKRVPCCAKCNNLKGCLPMDHWFWFIRAFPRWWKLFDTPKQVADAVMEHLRLQSKARAERLALGGAA